MVSDNRYRLIPWLPEPELVIAGQAAPPMRASEAATVADLDFTGQIACQQAFFNVFFHGAANAQAIFPGQTFFRQGIIQIFCIFDELDIGKGNVFSKFQNIFDREGLQKSNFIGFALSQLACFSKMTCPSFSIKTTFVWLSTMTARTWRLSP